MREEKDVLSRLRRVFSDARGGRGIHASLVLRFGGLGGHGKEVAREVLLGHPMQVALEQLQVSTSREVGLLVTLLRFSSRSSTRSIGSAGEDLSGVVKRWLDARDSMREYRRILRVRGLIVSGIMGSVVAMLATLSPVISSFGLASLSAATSGNFLVYGGVFLVTVSSSLFGMYTGADRFYVNPMVAIACYALVTAAIGPLAVVPFPQGAIK